MRSCLSETGKVKSLTIAGSEDAHATEAAILAMRRGFVRPVFVGNAAATEAILRELGENPDQHEIYNTNDNVITGKKVIELVREGKVDCILKGALQTSELLKPVVNSETGIKKRKVLSHVTCLEIPEYHKVLCFTDGAMMIAPDFKQRLSILQNGVDFLHKLGYECPKVAIIEANEVVNPKIQTSVEAAKFKEMYLSGEITGCVVEGPISVDLAVSKEVCEMKHYESAVGGDADLLVAPFITVISSIVKGLQIFAHAQTTGVVMGADVPILLVSRASSSQEKYDSILLGMLVS